jgi:HEAT repeat protein
VPVVPVDPGAAGSAAAAFAFEEVARVRDLSASLVGAAVESLVALGEPGRAAARARLPTDHAATLLVATRVLVVSGSARDRALVARRLQSRVPARTSELLLEELAAADPVLVDPAYLVGLLDHDAAGMRSAATRMLQPRVDASTLPLLVDQLSSARPATRTAVLDLVDAVVDPAALRILLDGLADRVARVAARAAELLAARDGASVVVDLRTVALGPEGRGPVDRPGAYALLALIDREDRRREAILVDADVPALLEALADPAPIVAGASAAALAGIGFRSEAREHPAWLDTIVPHTLVRYASGDVFHQDFSSLQRPGLGRLGLITGEAFGRNGHAWQAWWGENARGFQARRARLVATTGDERSLFVLFSSPVAGARALAGPDLARAQDEPVPGVRTAYLGEAAARDLLGFLEGAGVLGSTRLPGRQGAELAPARSLSVEVGTGTKRFEVADGVDAPWFDRVEDRLDELFRANAWQRWYDVGTHVSPRAAWLATHAEWEAETSPLERSRRLKRLILRRLRTTNDPVTEREGLEELQRLYAEPDVAEGADFAHLVDLLTLEPRYGGPGSPARILVELALVAAARVEPVGDGTDAEATLVGLLAQRLVERFPRDAREDLARILETGGPEEVRRAARDPDARLRAAAAPALARSGSEGDAARLRVLTDDPVLEVVVAAIEALGDARLEVGRDLLAARAAGTPEGLPVEVRAAALRSLARLGGSEVTNLCMLALSEDAVPLQIAAAEALAESGDPGSASILVSLFARGPTAPFYAAARGGLKRMGQDAWPELLRLTSNAPRRTRREAALLLSEEGVPEAASLLMTLLTEDPRDERVAEELAVLSCVDLREDPRPVEAWWDWWDLVLHDDALSWLRGAAERLGVSAPPPEALEGRGTAQGALFLLELAYDAPPHLAERARRELGRLLGRVVERPPATARELARWREGIEASIAGVYGG